MSPHLLWSTSTQPHTIKSKMIGSVRLNIKGPSVFRGDFNANVWHHGTGMTSTCGMKCWVIPLLLTLQCTMQCTCWT